MLAGVAEHQGAEWEIYYLRANFRTRKKVGFVTNSEVSGGGVRIEEQRRDNVPDRGVTTSQIRIMYGPV